MSFILKNLPKDRLPAIAGGALIISASLMLLPTPIGKSTLPTLPASVPPAILSAGLLCLLAYYIKLNGIISNSRDNFRAIIDSAPFGFILSDMYLTIRGTNFFISQMFEVAIPDMIGCRLTDWLCISEENIKKIKSLPPGESLTLPTLSYGSRKLEIKIHCPNAGVDSLFWHVRDITQQYEIEEKFEVLLNSLPIAVLEADRLGNIITANPQTATIAGHADIPWHTSAIFDDEDWDKIINKLAGESATAKGSIETGNRILSYSARIFHQSGHAHISCILQDITEETSLKEKLLQALQEAEAADKAKSSFLAKMSHEIRTPLNAVSGLAFILKDKVDSSEAKELIQNIIDSSNHLTQLIGDILDISKIESGKMELDSRPFCLSALLNNMRNNFSMVCSQKNLTFTLKQAHDVPSYIVGDTVRLKQIIYNIVGNSLKFVEQGGISLEVTKDRGGHIINFRVTDTGPGIPAEKLDNIFDAFVQEDNGLRSGGTGLGLAITRELLALMDGTIEVSSSPGHGTTFEFSIPFTQASSEEIAALEKETADSSFVTSGRALITDDVELNRKVLALLLGQQGWSTIQADSGERAIEILKKDKDFTCIFMDISMPGMDGTEAATIIKHKLKLKIPVVGVSAHALAGAREKYLDCCMDGYITKPINPGKLWKEIGSVVREAGAGEASPRPPSSAGAGEPLPGCDLVNFEGLLRTCQGSAALAHELLSDLLSELPKWEEELRCALRKGALKDIRSNCHRIRGTVSTLGAGALEAAALNLGSAARNGETEKLEPLSHTLFATMKETETSVLSILHDKLESPVTASE